MKRANVNQKDRRTIYLRLLAVTFVPFTFLWPYFFQSGKIANIENTAYILFPLLEYSDQLFSLSVPFWSDATAIGSPWPIPFGFTHSPFIFFVQLMEPMPALGLTLYVHAILSCACLYLIFKFLKIRFWLTFIGIVTFFYTGTLEYNLWADAPEVFFTWLMLPVMFLAVLQLLKTEERKQKLIYSLCLGLAVGYTFLNGHVGMLPIYFTALGLFFVFWSNKNIENWLFLLLAMIVSLIIGADKLIVYALESSQFLSSSVRDHANVSLSFSHVFWNLILKPLPFSWGYDVHPAAWFSNLTELYSNSRTTGFGVIFLGLAIYHYRISKSNLIANEASNALSGFRVVFVFSLIMTFFPDQYLPEVVSTFFVFREPAILSGVVLASLCSEFLMRKYEALNAHKSIKILRGILGIHVALVVAGGQPFIIGPMISDSDTFSSMGELNSIVGNPLQLPVVQAINQLSLNLGRRPRVAVTGEATLAALQDHYNKQGLYINVGFLAGWDSVSAIAKGISYDAIHPSQSKPYGLITSQDIHRWTKNDNGNWMLEGTKIPSLLAIDFIVALETESVSDLSLHSVAEIDGGGRPDIIIYQNIENWSKVIRVDPLLFMQPTHYVDNCGFFTTSCINFRETEFDKFILQQHEAYMFCNGEIEISISNVDTPSEFLVSQMFRDEWKVVSSPGTQISNWNGLIRLTVPKGVNKVILRYDPVWQKRARYATWVFLFIIPLALMGVARKAG